MAKTAAQRQADYRAQRAQAGSAERRLNTWINTDAFNALGILAERYGVTMRGVIETLLSLEMQKPRAQSAIKTRSAAKKIAPLSRNKSPEAAPAKAPAAAIKKSRAKKLPRNKVEGLVDQPDNKQPVAAERPEASRPPGAQFEFEL